MATSNTSQDYFNARSSTRQRPGAPGLQQWRETPQPRTPRTPTLGRTISQQMGSPGSFRVEQEDIIVYELRARHFSAGFAGEPRPRCILPFSPDDNRSIGDYRHFAPGHMDPSHSTDSFENWGSDYELYKIDLRNMDLGLVEDKLDRTLRTAMVDYLQLDAKPRRAVLVLPSLLPMALVEVALNVLFGHFTQPPSVTLLSQPIMCCVSAGQRHGLVIDIAWEETVVVAISEYKSIAQRRSIRAGKWLTREMANSLETSVLSVEDDHSSVKVPFRVAEDITQRLAWCRGKQQVSDRQDQQQDLIKQFKVALIDDGVGSVHISFEKLAEPVERALFAPEKSWLHHDDHDLTVHHLVYKVLSSLPLDVRALCVSRIMVTGGISNIPGLKRRILQEVTGLINEHRWDPVASYGSAKVAPTRVLQERSPNSLKTAKDAFSTIPLSPTKMPIQEGIPHGHRVHDDIKDTITDKVNTSMLKGKVDSVKGVVRGVETLGGWAGASLAASLRIKGVHEIERESFAKNGLAGAGLEF